MIPKFMAVSGGTFIILVLFAFCLNECTAIIYGLIALFFLAWQITGSVYVFREWTSYKSGVGCPNNTYMFAFGILITFWIIMALSLLNSVNTAKEENENN